MGCAHGLLERRDAVLQAGTWTSASASASVSMHPRETRILQSEVVDVCLAAQTPSKRSYGADAETTDQQETSASDDDDDASTRAPFDELGRQVLQAAGVWRAGVNAGGSRNDIESFARNPQYRLTVMASATGEEVESEECDLLIGLTQEGGHPWLPIALFVYKPDECAPGERLSAEYLLCVPEVGVSGPFTHARHASCRVALPPGAYVLVPATFCAGAEGAFLLRVSSSRAGALHALPDAQSTPGTP